MMRVKLCDHCGYQLARKAKQCPWCRSPVKNKNRFLAAVLTGLALAGGVAVAWLLPSAPAKISPTPETTQPKKIKTIKTKPAVKKSSRNLTTIYVKGQRVNLRGNPSLTSGTIRKLRRGQPLTQVSRLGNWLQVLTNDAGDRLGWIHASLVAKTRPAPSFKAPSERKALKVFQKSFDRFNANIKSLKGMTFFNDVEYIDRGVIQITATDILLSAPQKYQEKYLMSLMEMWLEARETTRSSAVKIVDKNGHLRLEETRS